MVSIYWFIHHRVANTTPISWRIYWCYYYAGALPYILLHNLGPYLMHLVLLLFLVVSIASYFFGKKITSWSWAGELTHTIQNMTWSRRNPCVLLYAGKLLGFGGREWYCTDFLFCHNYSKSSETTFVFGFEIVKSTNGFDKPFYTIFTLCAQERSTEGLIKTNFYPLAKLVFREFFILFAYIEVYFS